MKFVLSVLFLLAVISCGQNHHITQKDEGLTSEAPEVPDTPEVPETPVEPEVPLCTDAAIQSPTIIVGAGSYDSPYIICNIFQLQSMRNDLNAHYELGRDIDATVTQTWSSTTPPGAGFIPIGSCGSDYDCTNGVDSPFTGSFNGNGFTIDSLVSDRNHDGVALFGLSLIHI